MTTTLTCDYTATVVGAVDINTLQAKMAAVPIDFTLPNFWGLLLASDVTTQTPPAIRRRLIFKMTPVQIGDATAVAALTGNGNDLQSVTVTGNGGLYARPPIVTFTVAADKQPNAKANAEARMSVDTAALVLNGGTGYSGATTVRFVGGELMPGGVMPIAIPTIVFGVITAVTIMNAPGGTPPVNGSWISPPSVIVTDSGGGVGAEIIVGLSVESVKLLSPGMGYTTIPTVGFTPLFKAMIVDAGDQGSSLRNWMTQAFQNALKTAVATSIVAS